jgi:hypothetical protein
VSASPEFSQLDANGTSEELTAAMVQASASEAGSPEARAAVRAQAFAHAAVSIRNNPMLAAGLVQAAAGMIPKDAVDEACHEELQMASAVAVKAAKDRLANTGMVESAASAICKASRRIAVAVDSQIPSGIPQTHALLPESHQSSEEELRQQIEGLLHASDGASHSVAAARLAMDAVDRAVSLQDQGVPAWRCKCLQGLAQAALSAATAGSQSAACLTQAVIAEVKDLTLTRQSSKLTGAAPAATSSSNRTDGSPEDLSEKAGCRKPLPAEDMASEQTLPPWRQSCLEGLADAANAAARAGSKSAVGLTEAVIAEATEARGSHGTSQSKSVVATGLAIAAGSFDAGNSMVAAGLAMAAAHVAMDMPGQLSPPWRQSCLQGLAQLAYDAAKAGSPTADSLKDAVLAEVQDVLHGR